MSEYKSFSALMQNPHEEEISNVWLKLMELAACIEDDWGYTREIVLQGFLKGTLDLGSRREDQNFFRSMNETRRFYLFASEEAKRYLDTYPNYKTQRAIEELHGKDMLYFRNARNFQSEDSEDQ